MGDDSDPMTQAPLGDGSDPMTQVPLGDGSDPMTQVPLGDGSDPMTQAPPASDADLDALERRMDSWLAAASAANPAIDAIERGPQDERRWYVRVHGEEKEVWTIWFTLGQRTLHYETYLVPAPEENQARFYEHLLRRNRRLTGLKLEIGPEDAVFLSGSTPVSQLTAGVLDGILGSMYAATELIFRPAMRIGYASKFRG